MIIKTKSLNSTDSSLLLHFGLLENYVIWSVKGSKLSTMPFQSRSSPSSYVP